ncbi:MAG: LysR family transcriptional regulator [Lachnospiraceae bacterium]
MQIKNMSYIIALAEAGTLSGAGKQLGISQPTLSVFLSNLEQELGISIFLRDKKKLIPTPAGRIYMKTPDAFYPRRSRRFSPSVSSRPLRP